MQVHDDRYMVCQDCLMMLANDDASGLDYDYDEKEAVRRLKAINDGVQEAAGEGCYIVCGDSEQDEEFSTSPCDCCGDRLAGSRHHCVLLGN